MGEKQAMEMMSGAHLPWSEQPRTTVIIIQTWDAPEQIRKCCSCCMAQCTNCVENKMQEQNKGGKGKRRDISAFTVLYQLGMKKPEICKELSISTRTYDRMKEQLLSGLR